MYLGFFVLLATAATVFANSVSKTSQIHITTTTSTTTPGYHPLSTCTPHFIEPIPTSFPSRFTTAFIECESVVVNSTPLHNDDVEINSRAIIALTSISLLLELATLALIIWLGWGTYIRKWHKKRRSQKNAERQRAEHLLNDHLRPADLELGVIHVPKPPDSVSTNNTKMPAIAPNGHKQECDSTDTSCYYELNNNRARARLSQISNLTVDAEGIDITDSPIRQKYLAENGLTQAFNPITEDSETDPDMSYAPQDSDAVGPLASAARKPETYRYPTNLARLASPKKNGVVSKDWAYKNM